ncbi:TetR/AcrR family transcriptional regulator [Geodermatophilus ruber]|uniref:Transcriptional regulator, TetR family n=1 Tax=Geodermatophilus ruber TaxID=504800 RepID=A0A1I4GIR4_9ACTN|nr:TetR/AcrR family transcriptional regulator [Geodermatophilus ruber]SFL29928.1 transcriptional regulator, TetR family [Geodermatophilus ruber]
MTSADHPVAGEVAGAATRPRRRQSAEQTRQDILVAAGRRFARAGYAAVTLKDIAADVGVTAPLVVHYFDSKLDLFRAVAQAEDGPTIRMADLDGPVETMGLRLARLLATYWLNLDYSFPAIALVRSLDLEEARQLFAAEIDRRITDPLAAVLHGPDAQLRARLIAAQIMGFGLFAFGTLIDPDAPSPNPDALARTVDVFATALQACITPATACAPFPESAPRSA